jgi:O-antigen ligase
MDWDAAVHNPARRLGFYFGLAFIFLRFSMLHESIAILTGINTYLALLTGLPAIVLSVAGGGLARAWQSRIGKFWLVFMVFVTLSVPFSSWRGLSLNVLYAYLRADFPTLFILGGMVLTWKECKTVLGSLAISGICTLAMEKMFSNMDDTGRLSINGGGTIANSNDYAAHLLMLLPFVLWVVLVPGKRIYKLMCLPILVAGLFIDLKTGSRGALIAMAAGFLMILFKGPGKLRWILGFSTPVAIVAVFSFLPATVMLRFTSILGDDTPQTTTAAKEDAKSAADSSSARRYLLMKSLEYTVEHPLFGIGMGDFSSFEGGSSQAEGQHGQWQETHNSYTQVSSEAGIPAAICFIGAIVCALSSLNRTMSKARRDKVPIIVACAFCTMLSIVVMGTCMAFLTLGFRFYMPALTGLAICLERVLRMDPPAGLAPAPVPASWLVRTPVPAQRVPQRRIGREGFAR